ncbi:MAG: putative metal-binding motif-containing protein [Myxococcales bacterium]|nr:putative metal-binding motif-containing protein [Myxococcales bacterium]
MNAVATCSNPPADSDQCGDGIDNDCDGVVDDPEEHDRDADGFQGCPPCLALRNGEAPPEGQPTPNCDFSIPLDCNDDPDDAAAASVNPEADEVCDQIDNDCDGNIDEGFDKDGDGYYLCGRPCELLQLGPDETCNETPDCDDEEGNVRPSAQEVCDFRDNDCDDRVDEGFSFEENGERFYDDDEACGSCDVNCVTLSMQFNFEPACRNVAQPGARAEYECSTDCLRGFVDVDEEQPGCECVVSLPQTCDDGLAAVDLNGERRCNEVCNGVNDDCDQLTDEPADLATPACYTGPPETLGVGRCRAGAQACIEGLLKDGTENEDHCVGQVLPTGEVCNGFDDDCDGSVDEDDPGLNTPCETNFPGVCTAGTRQCVPNPELGEPARLTCVSLVAPRTRVETCNLLDDDCDGFFDEDTNVDNDAFLPCRACNPDEVNPNAFPNAEGQMVCPRDCDDENPNVFPGAPEGCNGIDDNCLNGIDESFVLTRDGRPIGLDGNPATTVDQLVYNRDDNCGACGRSCVNVLPNVVAAACNDQGTCEVRQCREGFENVNGIDGDGCEQELCTPEQVGPEAAALVGQLCEKPMYVTDNPCGCSGVYECVVNQEGRPQVLCVVRDIDGQRVTAPTIAPDRCERRNRTNVEDEICDNDDNDCDGEVDETFLAVDAQGQPILVNGEPVYSDRDHCGACGDACQPPNAVPRCNLGACQVASCQPGFLNLNGVDADGCELGCTVTLGGREACDQTDNDCDGDTDEDFDFQTDILNCGQCGEVCQFANADPACTTGNCEIGQCNPTHDDCDGREDNGCETPLDTVTDCGACRRVCPALSSNLCDAGQCRCGPLPQCAGLTPVCDSAECVECLNNLHCTGFENGDGSRGHPGGAFCIDRQCKECNPVNNAGCDADGTAQICGDNAECRSCQSDAECVVRGIDRDQCVSVGGVRRCVACDPTDNSGCSGDTPICDDQTLTCRGCRENNECSGGECLKAPGENEGVCEGCDPVQHTPCGGATPICRAGECQECLADADCAGRPWPGGENRTQCVEGRCQFCDPTQNHAGCGANELCCNFVCVATSTNQCEGCGRACDPNPTNTCVDRQCRCGGNLACSGQTSFCDDQAGSCVNCRGDQDCGGARTQCVQDQCEVCDPFDNNRGCNAASGRPLCDTDFRVCVACGEDADCQGNVNGEQCVSTGACKTCDPLDNEGCNAASNTPICRNFACDICIRDEECAANPNGNVCRNTGACGSCTGDADCNGHPNGNVCGNDGRCGTCQNNADCSGHPLGNLCSNGQCGPCGVDAQCAGHPDGTQCVGNNCRGCEPTSDEPCDGATPICNPANFTCRACVGDGECNARPGSQDQCVNDFCRLCDPADDAGCNDPTRPICDGTAFVCRPCASDNECPNNGQCVNGQCRACDPENHMGCDPDGGTPICSAATFTCQPCNTDGQCAESARNGNLCVGGFCEACDPADHGGCRADELCCNGGNGPECQSTGGGGAEQCTACNTACNGNSTNTCTNRVCRCGSNAACGGATPFCDDAQGNCVECVVDAHCGQGQCVGGTCRQCDPADHAGCNANQLCCANGQGVPECQATGPGLNDQCSVCGVACDQSRSNTCSSRSCVCGNQGLCGGGTPLCNDANQTCQQCLDDGDCGNGTICVGGSCRQCDPNDNRGCGADGAQPICGANFTCRACTAGMAGDMECAADLRNGDECVAGACENCDPSGDSGCNALSTTPICNGQFACVACTNNNDCEDAQNDTCLADGRCRACDPADSDGCTGFCNAQFACQACTTASDCGTHFNGNICSNGSCVGCNGNGNCNGHPLGTQCINSRCGCNDDLDCGGGVCNLQTGTCGSCTVDADCQGNPAGSRCDNGSCVECLGDADCGGELCNLGTNVCEACAMDADCAAHPIGAVCDGGSCVECGDDGDCNGQVCTNSECEQCQDDMDCGMHPNGNDCNVALGICRCVSDADCGDRVCDTNSGVCEACTGNMDCAMHPNGAECNVGTGECLCNGPEDCGLQVCLGAGICGMCQQGADCANHPAGPDCNPGGNCGCDQDTDCGTQFCNGQGACADCTMDADCDTHPDGDFCDNGACGCQSDADCPNGEACNAMGVCADCDGMNTCDGTGAGSVCNGGDCVECASDTQCGGGQACNAQFECADCDMTNTCDGTGDGSVCDNGDCVECLADSDCDPGEACNVNVCAACGAGNVCDGTGSGTLCSGGGACVECLDDGDCGNGDACDGNNECNPCDGVNTCDGMGAGDVCNGGDCVECAADSDCMGGQACNGAFACADCDGGNACDGTGLGSECDGNGDCVECVVNAGTAGTGCAAGEACVDNMGVGDCVACDPACGGGQTCIEDTGAAVCDP